MLRKLFAVGALVLATMCLTAPAVYADVGLALDPVPVVDQGVAPANFMVAITAPAVEFAAPDVASLPGSGDDEEPIAAFCPAVAPRLMPSTDGDPLRIDDPGWCLS